MTVLWDPFDLGHMHLPHRLAMAPMTRSRALPDGTPGPLAAEYYSQRASLGLLISEGTQPSDDGQGYLNTPGIYRPEHVTGWRAVTDAVHAAGAYLVIQLMHVGRVAHPDNTPHHRRPIAPSPIPAGVPIVIPSGTQPAVVPREMDQVDIARTIAEFAQAAASAMAAGADGVEIHGANGYLLHQFLSPNANLRSDDYGGSIEGRSRFPIQVATAVAEAIGPERVGVRISPGAHISGIDEGTPDDVALQYHHLVSQLAELNLGYLHLVHNGDERLLADVRRSWPNALLVLRPGRPREEFDRDVVAGLADISPIGRPALANPDLVARLRAGAPLNQADPATFYGGGAAGYTDYPTLSSGS